MDNITNFKIELKALLEKYGATIFCMVDGDTHGLSYESGVYFKGDNNDYIIVDSCEIEATDIKINTVRPEPSRNDI
jgi:hypothetical protein